ncbi:tyrosine-type recombinase/integrase [Altererythrobacter ishigakiensis]|uniref:Site-specific recombinase XerD n=1 Tax=Altererythrobacter ishigakiensis TaxID=476157 RepID=A0A562UT28_9SPHN|nr:tyrosine-type recombinase/integrase [Altererythrobacter ishigakiensis]TWJ08770.1 site-specific recombinase XerD [Altererythrobacter ishigakiensis]
MDLSKVKERAKLKPDPKGKAEPYWQRLSPGCFVGYCPHVGDGEGTWHARAYDEDKRGYRRRCLGSFASSSGNERFALAKKAAEAFAASVESGGTPEKRLETVRDACEQYAADRAEASARFERHVYGHDLAKVKLIKLRRRHLVGWREWLSGKPATYGKRANGAPKTRPRSPSSINRDIAALRAALNRAIAPGTPNTEADWQSALKAIPNADRKRDGYLPREQRKAVLAQLPPDAHAFFTALCLLPLRPGAMAKLKVADFNKHTNELAIGEDKNGKPRRFTVPKQVAQLIAKQSEGKPPAAFLFQRSNGKPWSKDSWKIPLASAVRSLELPKDTCAYTLRHSIITDLVNSGLPILTIAQISGTSVEMIERHYGHLVSDAAVKALETLEV